LPNEEKRLRQLVLPPHNPSGEPADARRNLRTRRQNEGEDYTKVALKKRTEVMAAFPRYRIDDVAQAAAE
jgi:hypothetical protein